MGMPGPAKPPAAREADMKDLEAGKIDMAEYIARRREEREIEARRMWWQMTAKHG